MHLVHLLFLSTSTSEVNTELFSGGLAVLEPKTPPPPPPRHLNSQYEFLASFGPDGRYDSNNALYNYALCHPYP